MIELPKNFNFTQQSIKTFKNCPFKFWVKYIEGIHWKKRMSEDVDLKIQTGNQFHLLCSRYFRNVDTGVEFLSDEMKIIEPWMENVIKHFPHKSNEVYLPEYKLEIVVDDAFNLAFNLKLEANFDLIVKTEEEIIIWDWKTGDSKKHIESWKEDLQSIVYLYVLSEAVKNEIPGFKEYSIDKIKMNYWKPDLPSVLASIQYDEELHRKNEIKLKQVMKEIMNYEYENFKMFCQLKHCKDCEFFAFCQRKQTFQDSYEEMELPSWDEVEELY